MAHAIHTTSTHLTTVDRALRADAARAVRSTGGNPRRAALAIGDAVRSAMSYELDVTGVRTTAADAWALRRGVCQDMAHVMIAMCRSQGIPARYVSGHLLGEGASHAWVEVQAGDGTLAYDPTHARETDLRYVTVAVGRDYRERRAHRRLVPLGSTRPHDGPQAGGRLRRALKRSDAVAPIEQVLHSLMERAYDPVHDRRRPCR